jgi:hypothetical protein
MVGPMGGLKGLDLVRHMQVRQTRHVWYQSKIQIVLILFSSVFLIRIGICIQPKMLDPDPYQYQINSDQKH